MSDVVVQQITEVQAAHERTGPPLHCVCGKRDEYKCECDTFEECECGEVMRYDHHPEHVAEQVATRLNLHEERGWIRCIDGRTEFAVVGWEPVEGSSE